MSRRVVSPDRLSHARKAVAEAGLDALLVTPGPDLRWLTGYEALPLERLTCLVLPARRRPVPGGARARGARGRGVRRSRRWASRSSGWAETETRTPPSPAGWATRRLVGLANRMWAEQVLRFRAALPAAEQSLGSEVLGALRMRKTTDEVDALRRAGQAIDRVHGRMAEFLRPGRTEREAGREIAAAILAEGHETVDFVIVGSGPNGASPHHEVGDRVLERRRRRRRRHRRHHRRGLLLGLHPDVRPRRPARRTSASTSPCCTRPSWPPASTPGPASPPSRSTAPPAT